MKQRKRRTLIYSILSGVIVVLLIIVGFGYMQFREMREENSSLKTEMENNKQIVYVATRFIQKGEAILEDGENANVEKQTIYTGLEDYNYITSDQLGSVAIIDIDEGVPVMYSMVTEQKITEDSREYEISTVNLATGQSEYDIVDVRITFPDGSDYIVLSKKEITNLNLENCVFTTVLNEEEILRYTCALIDAYTNVGARLYTTKYIESNIQEEAEVNYPVRDVTRKLIEEDPNIVTKATKTLNANARLSLEDRLGLITEEEREAVQAGIEQQQAATDAIINSQNEEMEEE